MPIDTVADRIATSFPYHREITKPFGEIDTVIAWSKNELTGAWRWRLVDPSSDIRPGRYEFFFDSDRDYCAFTLKWAN
jgi:hypothetical protein